MTETENTTKTNSESVIDDLRDGLKHTGSKELLRLLEDEVSDNSNIVDSIVQLIINKVKNIQHEENNLDSQIIKILNKIGKLGEKMILFDDLTKDLNKEDMTEYCLKLQDSYSYNKGTEILTINNS